MSRLFLIRHAAVDTAGRFWGTTDLPLSPQGVAQLPALVQRLADARRCYEIAQRACFNFNRSIIISPVSVSGASNKRGGQWARQPGGFDAFIPAPLPPKPALEYSSRTVGLLSRADQAVGRLDGEVRNLPNPDLFVAMYVRREAVLSSRIEGTQSTLEDLLAVELEPRFREFSTDVEEIVQYVAAMNHGLERLTELPVALGLIREIHKVLLSDGRGADKRPGEFRKDQNFIAPAGVRRIEEATFVPPPVAPVDEMRNALNDLERFLNEPPADMPSLVHVGLAHAQFETIHPFMDGNGRVGRLLITLLLVHQGILHRPLLYLSVFLRRHRADYYERLMSVRESGDYEGWLEFFLTGVAETAEEATVNARAIVALREEHRALIQEHGLPTNTFRLLDLLFDRPLVDVGLVRDRLGITFATANKLIENLQGLELMREITGRKRDRIFRFEPYLRLFEEEEEAERSNEAVEEPRVFVD